MTHKKNPLCLLRLPLYLWLAAIYPILHLYEQNFSLVDDSDAARVLALALAAASLAFIIANRLTRNPHQAALLLGVWSLVHSLSGHLYLAIFHPRSLVAWTLAAILLAALTTAALQRRMPKPAWAQLTIPLNLAAIALCLLPLLSLIPAAIAQMRRDQATAAYFNNAYPRSTADKIMDSPTRPDIYFIIPDGYPSDSFIREEWGYDNSAFTAALRERGFITAPHAQSNYGVTHNTLAAILNMRYYDSNPSDYNDLDYLRLEAASSQVAALLQKLGYTYIHYLSGFVFPSPIADINRLVAPGGSSNIHIAETAIDTASLRSRRDANVRITLASLPLRQPFLPLYIDTTLLRGLRSQLEARRLAEPQTTWHRYSVERFLNTIEDLPAIAAMPQATFAIVHLMQPHLPVNFNERGETIPQTDNPTLAQTIEDLRGSNIHYLRLIDSILQHSANPPVIIFQADHGSEHGTDGDPNHRYTLFDVYSAWRLPDGIDIEPPPTFTAINTFPLILNALFDMNIPPQPDRLIEMLEGYDDVFAQRDATDEFQRSRDNS